MAGFFSKLLSRGADKQLKEFEKIAARINEIGGNYAPSKMNDAEQRREP